MGLHERSSYFRALMHFGGVAGRSGGGRGVPGRPSVYRRGQSQNGGFTVGSPSRAGGGQKCAPEISGNGLGRLTGLSYSRRAGKKKLGKKLEKSLAEFGW